MITSLDIKGNIEQSNYATLEVRARKFAQALNTLGISPGDCVSTFAWNDIPHLEAYFAIPSLGAICHTVNPRLHADQLHYILQDAQSKWLFIDAQFIGLITPLVKSNSRLQGIIVIHGDKKTIEDLNQQDAKKQWLDYETLITQYDGTFEWPDIDENLPSGCCYTSGTTGNPKGVLYSHRSTVLHSMGASLPNALNISAKDTALVVVPMFHVNAWGMPYSATMAGAHLVLPGRFMGDGKKLSELILEQRVNLAAGVPTVWQNWITAMNAEEKTLAQTMRVYIGGAATTEALRSGLEQLGCDVHPAWGMTETSPVGTVNTNDSSTHTLSPGRAIFGTELRHIDDNGKVLPRDGKTTGELQIRGPWIASGYIGNTSSSEFHEHGWFSTGDIVTIHPDGYMHIADRAKDIIKSGGEWISSTILEDVASNFSTVNTAAVVAKPHQKWDERPVLLVIPKTNQAINHEELLAFFKGKVASWWIPDEVIVVDSLPMTATGKIDKKVIRAQLIQKQAV